MPFCFPIGPEGIRLRERPETLLTPNMDIQVNPSEYKLLIVDDVPTNVMLLQTQLSRERYEIITAHNGPAALAAIEKDKPDLLLLDIMMPGMDGFEVARILNADPATRHIPIIFISALNGSQDIVKGFNVGACDFISKPFNREEIAIRISHQISRVAARRIIQRQKERLHDIVREQNILFSVVARDLHFPLDSVKNALERIENAIGMPDDELRDSLFSVRETTRKIVDLLDTLFDRARNQKGKLEAIRKTVDLSRTIDEALSILGTAFELGDIRLHADTSGTVEAFADAGMIRLVTRHLLANAIQRCGTNGEITVTIEDGEPLVLVRIHDNGPGMTEQERLRTERILASDEPIDDMTEEESSLSVSRDFIAQNAGTLHFESEATGTTFVFAVPKRA